MQDSTKSEDQGLYIVIKSDLFLGVRDALILGVLKVAMAAERLLQKLVTRLSLVTSFLSHLYLLFV